MRYNLRFLREVEEDAAAAYEWYEERGAGLGAAFLQEFYAAATGLLANPVLYRTIDRTIRRCLLRRYPYSIYFTTEDDMVLVIGLFHCARDPRRIASELDGRDQP
jgi:plasmid stabilization system protein ParE